MIPETTADNIFVRVPPREEMVPVFRMVTIALSNQVGLNLDQADDLNTALEELFRIFVSGESGESPFSVRYGISSDRLEVTAEGIPLDLDDDSEKISRYSRFVIDSITDDISETPNPHSGYDILMVKYLSI